MQIAVRVAFEGGHHRVVSEKLNGRKCFLTAVEEVASSRAKLQAQRPLGRDKQRRGFDNVCGPYHRGLVKTAQDRPHLTPGLYYLYLM